MFIFSCCRCGEHGSSTITTLPNVPESRKQSREVANNSYEDIQVASGNTITTQPTVYRAIEIETVLETETVTEVATPILLARTEMLDNIALNEQSSARDNRRTVRVDVHCRGHSESDDNDDDDMDCSSSVSSNVETDATGEAHRISEPSTATASENLSPCPNIETTAPPHSQTIQSNPANMEWNSSVDRIPKDHLPEHNSTADKLAEKNLVSRNCIMSPLPSLPAPVSLEDEGRGKSPPTIDHDEENAIKRGLVDEHDYEDIYSVRGRDSGSHSRSPSTSSVRSDSHNIVADGNNDSSESGVSSPSPSELENKSGIDENDDIKLQKRHSLPRQSSHDSRRSLKRVVSVPVTVSPPPPPPPPPTSEESSLSTLAAASSLPNSTKTLLSKSTELEFPHSSPYLSSALPLNSSSEEAPPQSNTGGSVQASHLVNKQMVLPFIPPKFGNIHDPEALIKPSEYLKSLQGCPGKANGPSLSPPSGTIGESVSQVGTEPSVVPAPPPQPPSLELPPPPPPPPHQPLSTISIQDITSVQLKRTATKTMSCPHPSINGILPEPPFRNAKENLIAELKISRDISGIKKLKVERVEMEKKQDKEIASSISKQYSVDTFVEKVPDVDAAGNPIPAWKRQMLAKKAAEKARKEAEEVLARQAEQKRLEAIPVWKRHLLQKKNPGPTTTYASDDKPQSQPPDNKENSSPESQDLSYDSKEDEAGPIIPWRAQLRKTNSTLNLLE